MQIELFQYLTFLFLFIYLSIYLYIYQFINQSINLSIQLSNYWFIYLYINHLIWFVLSHLFIFTCFHPILIYYLSYFMYIPLLFHQVVLNGLVPTWWSQPTTAPKGTEGTSGYTEACALGLRLPDLGSRFHIFDFGSQEKVKILIILFFNFILFLF